MVVDLTKLKQETPNISIRGMMNCRVASTGITEDLFFNQFFEISVFNHN
jgi:hypothetical protein